MVGSMGIDKHTENSQALPTDTAYTQQAAMAVYGYQPERALRIIDSAVIVACVWFAAWYRKETNKQ